ncbi:E3 ubiquitin-protein ligase ARIH1 [Fragariocoptes setiger]|uniref:RBR-type E3 ubiquitin transferase n=1 Tax=Fragariocoptes setiger TaxID=1670756 RepID=A0ABQ7S5Z6_9ACAR|nr:E3 ubiquitin-protein ligase ARIH1 [Fragariocoptes setiger]
MYSEDEDDDQLIDLVSVRENDIEHEEFQYEVLTSDQIVEHMISCIKDVNTVVQLSPTITRILLNHFKWDRERLYERYYDGNKERLFKEAHIVDPAKSIHDSESASRSRDKTTELCTICCIDHPRNKIYGLGCGHRFCRECWINYLTTKIMEEGQSGRIFCAAHNCDILVDDQTVMVLITDLKVKLRYQHLITNSFVECNKLLRWCPKPECSHAIKVQSLDFQPVKCVCGCIFCFLCGDDWHEPVKCDIIRKWKKKCDDDSETSHWIAANTKECPKCHVTIEKDGGCNHMICKNLDCKTEFCWVCLGPWEQHGSSWFSCNKYDESEAKAARDAQERSRALLQRYLFYCRRYMNHMSSLKFENKLYDLVEEKMKEMQQHSMSWIEVQFLTRAVDVLLQCRQTLMYTYVFAYYLDKNNQSMIFEDNQSDLESATETLSEYLERDITSDNLRDIKQKVQDKYRYCESRRRVLMEHSNFNMSWSPLSVVPNVPYNQVGPFNSYHSAVPSFADYDYSYVHPEPWNQFEPQLNVLSEKISGLELICDSHELLLKLNFSEPFRGTIYPEYDRLSSCRLYGYGDTYYEFHIPLTGCGTREKNDEKSGETNILDEKSVIDLPPSKDLAHLSGQFFSICFNGSLELGIFSGIDDVYCKYTFVYGPDWLLVTGLSNGVTQISRKRTVTSVDDDSIMTKTDRFVWNLPINVSFRSYNPFGWPQLVVSVYKYDTFGTDVIHGYGCAHLPIATNNSAIMHQTMIIYAPESSSVARKILSWLTGRPAELVDPKLFAKPECRSALQTAPRVFTNNIIVRFHPSFEDRSDQIKTVICHYPVLPFLLPESIQTPSSADSQSDWLERDASLGKLSQDINQSPYIVTKIASLYWWLILTLVVFALIFFGCTIFYFCFIRRRRRAQRIATNAKRLTTHALRCDPRWTHVKPSQLGTFMSPGQAKTKPFGSRLTRGHCRTEPMSNGEISVNKYPECLAVRKPGSFARNLQYYSTVQSISNTIRDPRPNVNSCNDKHDGSELETSEDDYQPVSTRSSHIEQARFSRSNSSPVAVPIAKQSNESKIIVKDIEETYITKFYEQKKNKYCVREY